MSPKDARGILARLDDMLEWGEKTVSGVAGVAAEDFALDVNLVEATAYRIAVIGEAASKIPREQLTTLAPEIPWSLVVGMRNILIHEYAHVDPDQVFRTASEELPELLRVLRPVRDRLRAEG